MNIFSKFRNNLERGNLFVPEFSGENSHFPCTAFLENPVFPSKFYTNFVRIWQHEHPAKCCAGAERAAGYVPQGMSVGFFGWKSIPVLMHVNQALGWCFGVFTQVESDLRLMVTKTIYFTDGLRPLVEYNFHPEITGAHKNSPIFTLWPPLRLHNKNLLLRWVGWAEWMQCHFTREGWDCDDWTLT